MITVSLENSFNYELQHFHEKCLNVHHNNRLHKTSVIKHLSQTCFEKLLVEKTIWNGLISWFCIHVKTGSDQSWTDDRIGARPNRQIYCLIDRIIWNRILCWSWLESLKSYSDLLRWNHCSKSFRIAPIHLVSDKKNWFQHSTGGIKEVEL